MLDQMAAMRSRRAGCGGSRRGSVQTQHWEEEGFEPWVSLTVCTGPRLRKGSASRPKRAEPWFNISGTNRHYGAGGETSCQGVKGKVTGAETRRPTIVALKGPLQHKPP